MQPVYARVAACQARLTPPQPPWPVSQPWWHPRPRPVRRPCVPGWLALILPPDAVEFHTIGTQTRTYGGTVMPSLSEVASLIEDRKFEEAQSKLATITAEEQDRAEAAYFRGLILEQTDQWSAAIEAYEEAIDADDQHVEATFRLGYLLDLHGEEDRAVVLYERCVSDPSQQTRACTRR